MGKNLNQHIVMIDGKGENSKETYKLNEIILMEDMN
jgi:hypothetical protein